MRVTVLSGARRLATSIVVGFILGACGVQELDYADSAPTVVNACTGDPDCQASGMSSALCNRGMCVASSGDIVAAYVEVIPPASAFFGAGDSFLVPLESLDVVSWTRELKLPSYAQLTGRVTMDVSLLGEPPSENCEQAYDAASQSLRVHVELSRSNAVLGLPSLKVAANAELTSRGWEFSEKVPSGRYDVYATALGGCDADFPPILARNRLLEPGTYALELPVGALATLSGIVTPPAKVGGGHMSLAGWQVSLVDPDHGRLISTTRKLNDSNPTNFSVRYEPVTNGAPLLRLSPPEETVAPEVMWDLSVLDLDGNGQVAPNLQALDLSTVHVRARVIDADVKPIAAASVRLRSTKLLGAAQGLSARYQTVVTSDDAGAISLDLLPGTYQVLVTPPDQVNLAITEASWEIGRSPAEQAGRTVELNPKMMLSGSVIAPVDGQALPDISVSVVPSAVGTVKYLDRILSPSQVVPRAASGITDGNGAFGILVDPGYVDFSAKPSEASSFPWLVRARVLNAEPSLGQMPVSFPVPLAGTLRDPGDNLVQRALLRVFAVLDDNEPSGFARTNDPIGGDGVLQVAEGRTNDSGKFVLLLPSRLVAE